MLSPCSRNPMAGAIDAGRAAPRVMAMARPAAMPLPMRIRRDVHAFTMPAVYDRWSADAAGIRAVAYNDNVITMFDAIGEDYWSGNGVTAKKVTAQLRAIGDRPVEVQINSPGGDMFEGIAIFNVLREHPQPVTVKIMGYAASAASLIAMAGDRIEIGASCFVMIHNAWVLTAGNRHALVETAEWLAPFDQAMVDLYVSRTGQKAADVVKWMDAETYMSGSVAIERGFANALLSADAMKIDEETKAHDRSVSELRALELQLVASGATRADARERISRVRGLSGPSGASPASGRGSWSGFDGLLSALRS